MEPEKHDMANNNGATWSFSALASGLDDNNSHDGNDHEQTDIATDQESDPGAKPVNAILPSQIATDASAGPDCANDHCSRVEPNINTEDQVNDPNTTISSTNANNPPNLGDATASPASIPSPQQATAITTVPLIPTPNGWMEDIPDLSENTSAPVAKEPASWHDWVNANKPQPAGQRNVTVGKVRSLISTDKVTEFRSEALRDRLTYALWQDCKICYDRIAEGAMGRCGHVYCSKCLIEEALRERKCPLCKQMLNPVDLKVIVGA